MKKNLFILATAFFCQITLCSSSENEKPHKKLLKKKQYKKSKPSVSSDSESTDY